MDKLFTARRVFGGLAAVMFFCLLCIVGMIESGTVGLLLGCIMAFVNVAALFGCVYLAGGFEDYPD